MCFVFCFFKDGFKRSYIINERVEKVGGTRWWRGGGPPDRFSAWTTWQLFMTDALLQQVETGPKQSTRQR